MLSIVHSFDRAFSRMDAYFGHPIPSGAVGYRAYTVAKAFGAGAEVVRRYTLGIPFTPLFDFCRTGLEASAHVFNIAAHAMHSTLGSKMDREIRGKITTLQTTLSELERILQELSAIGELEDAILAEYGDAPPAADKLAQLKGALERFVIDLQSGKAHEFIELQVQLLEAEKEREENSRAMQEVIARQAQATQELEQMREELASLQGRENVLSPKNIRTPVRHGSRIQPIPATV